MPIKPIRMELRFRAGIADVLIIPVVTLILLLKAFAKRVFLFLVHILDYAFFVAMELTRFPLFAIRASGDGVIAAVRALVAHLPLAQERRQHWLEFIGRKWARIRRAISYRAFEQAVHHAFERGMEWVFKHCRSLSPRTALYVIMAAILWLPISIGLATGMHALLIAKATSLPAWMQLLHPFATVIAKSKLLVLPVYPAAWPQAKKHPFIQTILRAYRDFESLYVIQKAEHRYRQTESGLANFMADMHKVAESVGLTRVYNVFWSGICVVGDGYRNGKAIIFQHLSGAWLIGPFVQSYLTHLASMERRNERISAKVQRGFGSWSAKFSAEYYEAKEAERAAKTTCKIESEARSASDAAAVSLQRSQALPPGSPTA
ncbi:MAG: hypothetical protein E6G96_01830 [Alphaproteobacteria bacterium]|nr:MAG: hypothetical protein E6G96_01830 [Alphaproteobacteria bacterium]